MINLKVGGTYQFINQGSEHLTFIGKNGVWNQFEEKRKPGKVWSELLDSDLFLIEEVEGIKGDVAVSKFHVDDILKSVDIDYIDTLESDLLRTKKRLEEVEQWVAAIADDHEQIPDWIQQSARSLLALDAGVSSRPNNKTMEIERLEKRLAEVERERDELIVFSQYLIDCHKNGNQCLCEFDYSAFVNKFAIEQQIKGIEDAVEYSDETSYWPNEVRGDCLEHANKLRQQLGVSDA